jgi:hypothetical protein
MSVAKIMKWGTVAAAAYSRIALREEIQRYVRMTRM